MSASGLGITSLGCDDYFVTTYLPISQISEKLDSKLSFHWIPVPSYPESGRKTRQTFMFVYQLTDLAFQYAVFMHLLIVFSDWYIYSSSESTILRYLYTRKHTQMNSCSDIDNVIVFLQYLQFLGLTSTPPHFGDKYCTFFSIIK